MSYYEVQQCTGMYCMVHGAAVPSNLRYPEPFNSLNPAVPLYPAVTSEPFNTLHYHSVLFCPAGHCGILG